MIRHKKGLQTDKINHLPSVVLIAFLFFLDFITKFFVRLYNPKWPFINYLENTGVVLGVFQGYNLLLMIVIIILIFIIIYFYKSERRYWLGFDFILAGAFGNLFDRFCYGYVIDFIDLKYWPVFNLADVFIVLGVIIVLIRYVFKKDK